MAHILLTHIVGAQDLEPELTQMTLAANAWVLGYCGNSQWLVEVPDLEAFHCFLIPGWVLMEPAAELLEEYGVEPDPVAAEAEESAMPAPSAADEGEADVPQELLELDALVEAAAAEAADAAERQTDMFATGH